MTDELKKLYDQVDELRAKATRDGRHDLAAAYSRVLGLINTMLAERGDAIPFGLSDEQIKHMVNRFLGWKIPQPFRPDDGISFDPVSNPGTPYERQRTPSGTNLFSATEAEAMVCYMIDGMPAFFQSTIAHHYTAAEIEERLATAGSHPHGDARDLQMLRQVWTDLQDVEAEVESIRKSAASICTSVQGNIYSLAGIDVIAERQRQISVEGWTPEHDDKHDRGEIAKAAAAYAVAASYCDWTRLGHLGEWDGHGHFSLVRRLWPWDWKWWKPKDRRRDLVRAGALIIAEIERLDRKEPKP